MILGIPNDGTFDYRRVALLFRFKATPNDAFVVQLANRRLGESLINDFTPEVQLDWAFYERRLGDNGTLRIGKAPTRDGHLRMKHASRGRRFRSIASRLDLY